jgi:hypothetical protein
MASILAFQHPQRSPNWSNEELAELFRVVDILSRAGVAIDTDMGQSDEGEPWFAFCRADTGDVIVHFSRIDGQFVAVSAATDAVVRGNNFRRVAEALVNRQPLILPAPTSGQKLFLHPSVILTALVATTLAQMKSWDGQDIVAFDDNHDGAANIAPEASFSEILKTAFLDAMNLVLRGFTGPADMKHTLAENGPSLGLGLGNLSLASVLAFAISVIQGTTLQDNAETDGLALQGAEASEGRAQNAATMEVTPVATDTGSQGSADNQKEVVANADATPVKAAPVQRDVVPVVAMEKTASVADKADAMATPGDGSTHAAQKDLLDRQASIDARADTAQQKIDVAAVHAETSKVVVVVQPVADGQNDAKGAMSIQFTPSKVQHQFSITEISKEAMAMFFGNGAVASAERGVVVLADGPGGKGAFGITSELTFNGESSSLLNPNMQFTDASSNFVLAPVGRPALNASDIVFAGGDPVAMARLNLITDFVNSSESRMTGTRDFGDILKPFWAGDKALTVVVFDSEDLPLQIFSFTSDVLFVEEGQLAGASIDLSDNSLQVDLANGGDVMLLGVINLAPLLSA